MKKNKYLIKPNINNSNLTKTIKGFDEKERKITTKVVNERPLTIFLNKQEIVTLMSICDHPKFLSVGYLLNQNMIKTTDKIKKVEFASDLETVVVRTDTTTNYEKKRH